MLMLLNYCGNNLIPRVAALSKGRVLGWHLVKSPTVEAEALDAIVVSSSWHILMHSGRKINIGLFDECLLEIFKWKEQKHPRLHLFSHQLFL